MKLKRIARSVAIAALTMHLTGASVWAQARANLPDEEQSWLKWAIAVGILVVTCAASLVNVKRSHLT